MQISKQHWLPGVHIFPKGAQKWNISPEIVRREEMRGQQSDLHVQSAISAGVHVLATQLNPE